MKIRHIAGICKSNSVQNTCGPFASWSGANIGPENKANPVVFGEFQKPLSRCLNGQEEFIYFCVKSSAAYIPFFLGIFRQFVQRGIIKNSVAC